MKNLIFFIVLLSACNFSISFPEIFSNSGLLGKTVGHFTQHSSASVPYLSNNVQRNTQAGRVVPVDFPNIGVAPPTPSYYIPPIQNTRFQIYEGGPIETMQCQCTPYDNCEQKKTYSCDTNDQVLMMQARPGDIVCCPVDKLIC